MDLVSMHEVKRLSSAVRAFACDDDACALLADGTWQAGGCWLLAAALSEILASSRLVLVGAYGVAQHALVRIETVNGPLYVDAEGVEGKTALLTRMEQEEGIANPCIVEHPATVASLLKNSEIVHSAYLLPVVKEMLLSHLRRLPAPGQTR